LVFEPGSTQDFWAGPGWVVWAGLSMPNYSMEYVAVYKRDNKFTKKSNYKFKPGQQTVTGTVSFLKLMMF
jgi:hypothetical protein